jgi:hypothetical protein
MSRPAVEVADILHAQGDTFVAQHPWLSVQQRSVLRAIARCRTAALGGHVDRCHACGHQAISYNSCRNRHCMKCQAQARERWLQARERDLLDVPYVHVVFTLPHALLPLAYRNSARLYTWLFQASAATLREIAADPRHLGAEIGMLSILHTWGQTLVRHPHVHCVVPAGGLSADQERWVHPKCAGFFLPVKVLSRVFRGKCVEALRRAYDRGDLDLAGGSEHLHALGAWRSFVDALFDTDWVQADWKTIGPVRHNKSEVVWNRFRAAADKFFERYHNRHQIAAAEKIAEHAALVAALENLVTPLVTPEEAPADLAAQVQTLRATISKAPHVDGPDMKALHERWKAALAALVSKWPAAFSGTDLDPAAIHERMEKLIAKVENLIKEEKPAAATNKSATELLAERLRSALASNAMGGRADDTKWRAASAAVEEAQDAWQRIAPVPGEDTSALEARFKAACKRVMDQVKLHVSAPVGGPGGGFGGGRPGGRPGPGSRGQGPGYGGRGSGSGGRGSGSGGRSPGAGPNRGGQQDQPKSNDAQPVGA